MRLSGRRTKQSAGGKRERDIDTTLPAGASGSLDVTDLSGCPRSVGKIRHATFAKESGRPDAANRRKGIMSRHVSITMFIGRRRAEACMLVVAQFIATLACTVFAGE